MSSKAEASGKVDWGKTLNLPKTSFSMRANLVRKEPKFLDFWRENRIYYKLLERNERERDSKTFILHDGPPYSNGRIHLGQAWNKILKDFVVKYKLLKGYYSPFVPGWDTHGLPNELAAIKTYNIDRKTASPMEIRERSKELAVKYSEMQKEQFVRLGVFADWDNPYLTLDPSYESAIVRVFRELVEGGYIYRGLKPVFWCHHCETSLAEAEIEYKDKTSPSIYVKFPIEEPERLGVKAPLFALIWTTTPWTLPANVAIAYNPEASYIIAERDGEYYLLGETAFKQNPVFKELGLRLVKEVPVELLQNLKAKHPFLDRESVFIAADYVSLGEGTDLVHTAPGHGEEDFESGKRYNLPVLVGVDEHGYMTDVAGPFKGLHVTEADERIIEHLEERGLLLYRTEVTHSYPHCWRCKNPVIFRASEQWFLNVEHNDLRSRLLREIDKVKWYPAWGYSRIKGMIETRPDWCLSRQRVWGVPIPAFYCKNCGHVLLDPGAIRQVEEVFKVEGADSWWKHDADYFLKGKFKCENCGSTDFEKERDIFDVWFESAVSHSAVLKTRSYLRWPSDLYLEGNDQHRGWFQVSLITSVAAYDQAPYKEVVTHGWVLDEHGRAMHKSLGNVIDPMDVVERYGADILRLYLASMDYKGDIKFSYNGLEQAAEIYKKWRNTIRFMLGNLYDFSLERAVPIAEMPLLDRYAIYKLSELISKVTDYFDVYEFHKAYQEIHNYIVRFLSSVYLDVRKDVLYTYHPDSLERRAAQTVIYETLRALLTILFPILSFTAEEAWQVLSERFELPLSVALSPWPESTASHVADEEREAMDKLLKIRDMVNDELERAKRDGVISQPPQARVIIWSEGLENLLSRYSEELRELLRVAELKVERVEGMSSHEEPSLGSLHISVENPNYRKCQRCWNYYPSLSDEHPELCDRCVAVLRDMGQL